MTRSEATVIVFHADYGCKTGCCGHVVQLNDEEVGWVFRHPRRDDDLRQWARDVLIEEIGEEHADDLDWERSKVLRFNPATPPSCTDRDL